MMEEFSKAADLVADLLLQADVDWARLFQPYPFFTLFKNFLQVCVCVDCAVFGSVL
jgi:poly(A) polymerase Pap1